MDVQSQNPDKFLETTAGEEKPVPKGKLKIFFGYASGVGKTYAMLKAAQSVKRSGIDVIAGYVETHARPGTAALLARLETLPALIINKNGIDVHEFDLNAAISRRPQFILIDELAHTNTEGMRHAKRYQDIEEILRAGIDVYTTVNVEHIESLNDTVSSITGVQVVERIPDSVFDSADQVELIDIEPQELIERLVNSGKQAENTAGYLTVENLTALREIALRRCADRVNIQTENARVKNNSDIRTDEHILVCLSTAPSNAKIIRTAARMASAFKGIFTALFVETPEFRIMDEQNKMRLRSNIRIAQQLGARIETVYGDDISYQIAEYARLSGVTKIVIGRSNAASRRFFSKPSLTEKLIENAPNLDIHIIPDSNKLDYRHPPKSRLKAPSISLGDTLKSLLILLAATLIGFVFSRLGFTEANTITVYILGVLIISIVTTGRIYSLASSLISVLIFSFFFTSPRFKFTTYGSGYPVTFVIMFLSAFIMGSIAAKLKEHARKTAQAAYRTKILLDTNQFLQRARDVKEIIKVTADQLVKLLDRSIVVYISEKGRLGEPDFFPVSDEKSIDEYVTENEKAAAEWVLKNNKHAGASTDTLSNSKCLYLAIRAADCVYGVVGIAVGEQPLDIFENSVLLSILSECALSLENEQNAREKEEAAVLAKNEQLRANLLRSISHDLRTPLTSISGNASNLMSKGESFDENTKLNIYSDIYDDSMWLINLVENLLSVSRIEDGRMQLHYSTYLIEDIIAEALRHINRKSDDYNINVRSSEDYILVQADSKLIIQVIINIVDNAIKYTPEGSDINIFAEKNKDIVTVRISDDGPGIPDDAKPFVFDMFYTGRNPIADSRRSLGLGLSLCKSIIQAHGGAIIVSDNTPHGAVFTFTLHAGEVKLHE